MRIWLRDEVKLPQYFDLFIRKGFNSLECFEQLCAKDLAGYGMNEIKLGHRKKILRYVRKLQKSLDVESDDEN